MKHSLTVFFALFCLISSIQAQYHYRLTSLPDSAAVYFNGELKGHTPILLKYYWRDRQDGQIKIELKKEGYKDWEDVLTSKPMDFDEREKVYMEQDFERIESEDLPLIAFDRLLIDFRDDRLIGRRERLNGEVKEIKWNGSIKVGDESYGEKFIDIATDMGFNTLRTEYSQLFAGEKDERPKLPRFLVGAKLLEYNIQMKEEKVKNNFDPMKSETRMKVEWNVLDKKTGKVVLKSENEGAFNFRQEIYQNSDYTQRAFSNSLVKFLSSAEFMELIKNADDFEPEAELANEKTLIKVNSPKLIVAENFSDRVKLVNPACVSIITDGGFGSGAIVDANGLVLTAYHVVEGVNKIEVKFSSGVQLPAEIISSSKLNDLAILKISGSGYTALPIKSDAEATLGDDVFTIGTPADVELGQSISRGIVSGKRKIDGQIYLQLDMAVSPGNSGGPLLNQNGEIIGVVLRKIIDDGVEGIGFAVPSKELIEALNLEIEN